MKHNNDRDCVKALEWIESIVGSSSVEDGFMNVLIVEPGPFIVASKYGVILYRENVKLRAEIDQLKTKLSKYEKCPTCSGTGQCNDADLGDIYFNTWPCPECKGKC